MIYVTESDTLRAFGERTLEAGPLAVSKLIDVKKQVNYRQLTSVQASAKHDLQCILVVFGGKAP